MKITFCGHSDFEAAEKYERYMQTLFTELIGEENVEFYIGKDGRFDTFALKCVKEYKLTHPATKIIFVTPYLSKSYSKLDFALNNFDEVIYPSLEKVPYRYAIIKRNEWMVNKSDILIAFIEYSFGGAAKTFEYAKRKKKKIINIAEIVK